MAQASQPAPAVMFWTPGEMDPRSFMTFGLNVKLEASTAIGYFGTGLKYAIAVILRYAQASGRSGPEEGISIWIGLRCYEFYTRVGQFRDTPVAEIKCRRTVYETVYEADTGKATGIRPSGKSSYITLPFTLALGRNWTLWQAFRELESNTRDEKGETLTFDGNALSHGVLGQTGMTHIYVRGQAFQDVYRQMDQIFLNTKSLADAKVSSSDAGSEDAGPEAAAAVVEFEIFDRPSQYIYYRGVRVLDLNQSNYSVDREKNPITSRYTYNILRQVELTEDRTIKYPFMVLSYLAGFISQHTDVELIRKIVSVDGDKFWEGKLDFSNGYQAPSEAYRTAIRATAKPLASSYAYYRAYEPIPPKPPEFVSVEALKTIRDTVLLMPVEQLRLLTDGAELQSNLEEFLDSIRDYIKDNTPPGDMLF